MNILNEWMNKKMNEWINKWMIKCISEWKNERMNEWMTNQETDKHDLIIFYIQKGDNAQEKYNFTAQENILDANCH